MIETIIATILTLLAEITHEKLWEKVKLAGGVEEGINKLQSELKSIKAVLVEAEKRRVKDESVRVWLEKLEAVLHESEGVLSEWIKKMRKIEDHGSESSPVKKVCFLLNLCCFGCNKFVLRRDIARKIKKINEKLGQIAKERERYKFNESMGSRCPDRPKTTSFYNPSEVVGRDEERETIIRELLSNKNQNRALNIVSIVGEEGIGKTTLAHLVFNSDDDVIKSFDIKLWVCVAEPNFDQTRIAKAMLEAITGSDAHSKMYELQTIAEIIRNHVKGKKILLVLDDVYIEDFRVWEQLFNPLRTGKAGSTVLATTMVKKAATSMQSSYKLSLEKLSARDSWHLFKQIAFHEQNEAQWGSLENIWTSQIAENCDGSPLAIKKIGIQLRSNEPDKWNEILSEFFASKVGALLE